MTFEIHINELRLHAHIGATPEEQILGQSLLVDLQLEVSASLERDQVSQTLDYSQIIAHLGVFASELGHVKLVETFADRLLQTLLKKFAAIDKATVRVKKLYVPIPNFTGHVCIVMQKTKIQ